MRPDVTPTSSISHEVLSFIHLCQLKAEMKQNSHPVHCPNIQPKPYKMLKSFWPSFSSYVFVSLKCFCFVGSYYACYIVILARKYPQL
jgi:hypothetical protein